MDSVLCDELITEIFLRLPPHSLFTTSLVSKRWLRLSRRSTTSLSLHPNNQDSLPSFLHHFPFLSSLSLSLSATSSHHLLLPTTPSLRQLRILSTPPPPSSLVSLSSTYPHLTSLSLPLCRPLSLSFLPSFPSLKHLSLIITNHPPQIPTWASSPRLTTPLPLETLSILGLSLTDDGMGLIWCNCTNLQKLRLRSCDGVGDGGAFSSFSNCLEQLTELELRSCRSISDIVLLKLAENSLNLSSLLVYDGSSKDGLLHFITNCKANLRKIDLRLPLDLENQHLLSMGGSLSFNRLLSFRLQSCCLVSGDGLKGLSLGLGGGLEELGLINCDVVDRVPGLLTTLGQNLRVLRRLDLSYNEMLMDKEVVAMLGSCGAGLVEVKLRGCKGLTGMSLMSIGRICGGLECVDVVHCCAIGVEALELFLLSSNMLRKVFVEECKLSDVARSWASNRYIEIGE